MVHWGLVQLGRHGQARCALRLRPRAATTVRPEQFRPWVHTWNVLRPRARVLLWSLSGATGQLSGASACRRALGPRRAAGAARKGGACCGGSGAWRRSSPTSAARLASRRLPRRRKGAVLPLGQRLARSRPPPPPGGGLRRHRRPRGRRHLPRRHLLSSVDRCGGRPGLHMAGAACGGEAGALADEAEQARAYVAWLCRHALNPHTERPCTLPVTARTPCAHPCPHPCPHRAHRRAWVRAAWSARG